ncbi:MAG: hypothetical protein OEY85_05365 [Rhodospirillales bacterium]|nr:hypothetical protein [Rhodospirillales bacterium]
MISIRPLRTLMTVLCLSILCLSLFPDEAFAQGQDKSLTAPHPTRVYRNPAIGYSLNLPEGVELIERESQRHLTVRSSKGYAFNLQTGQVNSTVSLPEMILKLETLYLGKGKAWSQKLTERSMKISGLPAWDAFYEGPGTRARVIVARGRVTDFVFMFFATPQNFDSMQREFDQILLTFKLPPAEIDGNSNLASERFQPGARPPGPGAARFAEPGFGYSIDYPLGWSMVKPNPKTVVFNGHKGSRAKSAAISVQNVYGAKSGSAADKARTMTGALKSQLASGADDVAYLGEADFIYMNGGRRLNGRQFFVSYARGENRIRQWVVVMPRDSINVVHIWTYAAPERWFKEFRPLAEEVLKSWTILPFK